MHEVIKAIAIVVGFLIGIPIILFLVYAANGGAAGSSSLSLSAWIALIVPGALFIWGMSRLAMWRKKGHTPPDKN